MEGNEDGQGLFPWDAAIGKMGSVEGSNDPTGVYMDLPSLMPVGAGMLTKP